MPKGGARIPSDSFAVSKAMGLEYYFETLNVLNNSPNNFFQIDEVLNLLNRKFAYWDDGKTETCRGTLKELWRFDFIEKFDREVKKIELNQGNWKGGSEFKYKISNNGKRVVNDGYSLFSINVAKALLVSLEREIFPQLKKIFKITKLMGKFPVNSEEHVKISKDLDLYVEEHAGKSIKFGLLESTGIFYRKLDYFYLNEEWINNLKIYHFKFDNHKNFFKLLSLSNVKKSFSKDEILEINYKILDTKIKLNNNIKINLFNNFNLIFKIENIEIIDDQLKIKLKSLFSSRDYTDSNILSLLGNFEVNYNNLKILVPLPELRILTDDHEWELKICEIFQSINVDCFHLSGKSDRPDAIIDLSGGINKENILDYLRDTNKDKLMMETTLGEYSFSKLKKDLSKFINHSTKVLKIQSKGQLIVAKTFEKNIEKKLELISDKIIHSVSLIDYENIIYLRNFKNYKNFNLIVKNILLSKKFINKEVIDKYFSTS
jgi:hypothetical protein